MLFNSLEFAIFFPVVVALYFLLAQEWRVRLLLVASCLFYMAFIPAYILILFVTIIIDYVAGIYIEKSEGKRRRLLLWISIVSTCTVLAIFKYLGFFEDTVVGIAGLLGWQLSPVMTHVILPIGLSFHTFQSLSYVVEVYRGHQSAERNFYLYATYVMFFPQLVAGPIERPQNLLHQFREHHHFDYTNVTEGLKLMAWGFFKKLVVADRLALYVNDVYGAPTEYNGLQLSIATFFFAYQIYCDFSGYSDIAIGAARVLGFNLMQNFRTPYHSKSVSEFWRRWHISLSTWFKDYLYIPLGGARVGRSRHIVNLLITFGVSGLWHGANWTFVCWGVLNGIFLVVGSQTKELRNRFFDSIGLPESTFLRKCIMVATTFSLTCIAWVVFRAESLGSAVYILSHMFTNWDFHSISTPHFLMRQMPVAVAAILLLELSQYAWPRVQESGIFVRMPVQSRWALYTCFVMAVLLFGVYQKSQFIYFQF